MGTQGSVRGPWAELPRRERLAQGGWIRKMPAPVSFVLTSQKARDTQGEERACFAFALRLLLL